MIIEYEFVTTLPADEALGQAANMGEQLGFTLVEVETNRLRFQRGKSRPAKARNISELPQSVEMLFDRGRVTMAVSAMEATKKPEPLQKQMQLELIRILQQAACDGVFDEQHLENWAALEAKIALEAKRKKRRRLLLLVGVVVFIVLFSVGLVVLVLAAS